MYHVCNIKTCTSIAWGIYSLQYILGQIPSCYFHHGWIIFYQKLKDPWLSDSLSQKVHINHSAFLNVFWIQIQRNEILMWQMVDVEWLFDTDCTQIHSLCLNTKIAHSITKEADIWYVNLFLKNSDHKLIHMLVSGYTFASIESNNYMNNRHYLCRQGNIKLMHHIHCPAHDTDYHGNW